MGGLHGYCQLLDMLCGNNDRGFVEITAFQPGRFADFGKRRTSFGNMAGSHWRRADFIVTSGHEYEK
jgi:hypothetical protein